MDCEIINTLNVRTFFSCTYLFISNEHVILNCLHYKAIILFSKVDLLSIAMPRNFSVELPSITGRLILMDFPLKRDQNKLHFEAFALKLL